MRCTVGERIWNFDDRGRNQERPALVFLHYFAGSSWEWASVIDLLSEGQRCLAPDLPGFGTTSMGRGGSTVDAYVNAVEEFLSSAGIGPHILIGHSMGGKIACGLAARQRPQLLGLVLLAPSPLSPEPIDESTRKMALAAHGDQAAAVATLDTIASLRLSDAVCQRVVHDSMSSSAEAWRAWYEVGSREDLSALASQITIPMQVAVGSHDRVLPPQTIAELVVNRFPQARLQLIPGAGHLLPLESPVAISQLIENVSLQIEYGIGAS